MNHLHQRIVWITGASSGIGEALAYAFAEVGARLILSARNRDELERVAAACRPRAEVRVLPLDISDHAAIPAAATAAAACFGKIDLLVNNAGVGQRAAAVATRPEVTRRIMDVNFFGTVELTRAVLPAMITRGDGRIVVVSSVLGKFELPGRSTYVASKHALHGYFDTLRAELASSGVGVTIVCPGWIETRISQNALEADGRPHAGKVRISRQRMSAATCARHIVRAVRRGRDEATMGGWETAGIWLKRFFPGLFRRLIRRLAPQLAPWPQGDGRQERGD